MMWDAPPGYYIVLPQFRCERFPDSAQGYIETNGEEIKFFGETTGKRAKFEVKAKPGVGWGGFNTPDLEIRPGFDEHPMLGWPRGDWSFNSVWPPFLGSIDHFELTFACVDPNYLFNDYAWTTGRPGGSEARRVFPWVL